MGRRGWVVGAFAAACIACGGPQTQKPPDLGTLSIPTPPPVPQKPNAPVALARPDGVLGWVHVDDPDSILDLLGVTSQSLAANNMLHEIITYFESVDFRQPIDVVVVATGKNRRDVDVATKFGLKDPKAFFRALGKHLEVVERGERIHFQKKAYSPRSEDENEPQAEDVFICELAGTGAERATCGTPKAMESVGEWLRSGPEPPAQESTRTAKGPPMARVVVFGEAVRRTLKAHRGNDEDDRSSASDSDKPYLDLLEDIDFVSFDLAREEKQLAFSGGLRLRSATSSLAKEMLTTPNDGAPGDAFFRLWQDASAVAFTPGGGPLPGWIAEWADTTNRAYDEKHDHGNASATAKAIGKVLEKPVTIGYGVHVDQAKTALAAVRAAKDPEKASAALAKALDEFLVYAIAVEPASAEKALKDLAATWTTQSEARDKKYGSTYPATKYGVRAAPARLGLPKGSFFFETTSADWRSGGTGSGNRPSMKTKTEYVINFPNAGGTWGLTCVDEKACVDGVKRLLAPSPNTKRAQSPLFQRKGIVVEGYLSSLVGAFTMHRYSMASPGSGGIPSDVLADIEHDLASPRLEMPFVVTTQKEGNGGTVAFELRGERDAFKVLGEHAGFGGGSGVSLLLYLAMFLGH